MSFPDLPAPSVEEIAPLVTESSSVSRSLPLIELTPSQLAYRKYHGGLTIIIPCAANIQPLVVEQFANKMVECIELYFEEKLTPLLVESHQATLMQLLYEMLDAGVPRITEPDILKGLVPATNLLDALWTSSKQLAPKWDLYWRRQGIVYTKNQIYIDIIESLHVVMDGSRKNKLKSSKMVSGSAYYSTGPTISAKPLICRARGQIRINSHLSGDPRISLQLSGGHNTHLSFTNISFHPSVDYSQWASRGVLGFTPPDGVSVIGEYTLDMPDPGLVHAELMRNMGTEKTEFEIRISTNMDTMAEHVQDLVVIVIFPQTTGNVKELRLTSGDLATSDATRAQWSFGPKTPLGWHATLRGLASADSGPVQPLYVTVNYKIVGRIPSKISVSNLSIQNIPSQDRPYRGVRYQTIVDSFEVR